MKAILAIGALAACVAASSTIGRRPDKPAAIPAALPSIADEPSPIDPLDRRVQAKMHTVGQEFGTGRLVLHPGHLRQFAVRTPKDEAVVADLRREGWAVGIYVGSWDLLAPEVEGTISEAIPVVTGRSTADLPRAEEMKAVARRALAGADSAGAATGSSGRWTLDARVIRADRQRCLDCHSGVRVAPEGSVEEGREVRFEIGDPLGVAVYAYARAEPGRSTGSPEH